MHDEDKQTSDNVPTYDQEWDEWPEVKHEASVKVLEVDKSELTNQLVYVLHLQDTKNMKNNRKHPLVLRIVTTDDGRFIMCSQDDYADVIEHYKLHEDV